MKRILLLLVITAAVFAGYLISRFIKQKVNPRQSPAHFFLYLGAHLFTIFILVTFTGLIIIHFKVFLFK